jgi:hypothetical protein
MVQCPPGRWGDPAKWIFNDPHSGYQCEECAPGSLTNTGTAGGATACTACDPGKFSSDSTDAACDVCPMGWVTNTLAQSGAVSCTACPAGSDSDVSTDACTECSPGLFSVYMSNNGTNCTKCYSGYETDTWHEPGGTTCTICAAGRFSPVSSTPCRNCPGGFYQPEVGSETCLQCRGDCLPSGSPSIQKWDYGGQRICGVTNKAVPGATFEDQFAYRTGMSLLGQYKDARGDLTNGPFVHNPTIHGPLDPTGATACAHCEAGFKVVFLTEFNDVTVVNHSSGDSLDSPSSSSSSSSSSWMAGQDPPPPPPPPQARYMCVKCLPGNFSVPNSAACHVSCPPATYTMKQPISTTGDPVKNQYPVGMDIEEVGECVPCGYVETDLSKTRFFDILDDDDIKIGQVEQPLFYEASDRQGLQSATGIFEECCASPFDPDHDTANGFAQTARGCIECPFMDRCVMGQCDLNSAGEACSQCRPGYFSLGSRCIECPKDAATEAQRYGIVVVGSALLMAALWRVTRVKSNSNAETEADAVGQTKLEGLLGDVDTALTVDATAEDSERALSNTAIFAGISLTQLQLSSMTFELPIGFPLELAKLARYLSGIVSFDIGALASPECSVASDQGIVFMLLFKFMMTHGAFFAFCIGLVTLCKHGERHSRHTVNCVIAVYTLMVATLVKSCVNVLKVTYRGEALDIWTLDISPSVIVYKGSNANEQLEVDPLVYPMLGAGLAGLVIYTVLIPMIVWAELKIGSKASEQVARGVKNHLMTLHEVTVREDRATDSYMVGILRAGTIVEVFEREMSPSGKVRARIGEQEWITVRTHIKELCCEESGIYVKNAAFQEKFGWVVLKYTPQRWWFEIPIIANKVFTIVASELLQNQNSHIRLMFATLLFFTVGLLLLVVIDKPFKDGAGVEGWTGADKAEAFACISVLFGYGVAIWCWQKTSGCSFQTGECTYDDAVELTESESLASVLMCSVSALAPTIYMVYEVTKQRRDRRRAEREALYPDEENGELADDYEKGTEGVKFTNPMGIESETYFTNPLDGASEPELVSESGPEPEPQSKEQAQPATGLIIPKWDMGQKGQKEKNKKKEKQKQNQGPEETVHVDNPLDLGGRMQGGGGAKKAKKKKTSSQDSADEAEDYADFLARKATKKAEKTAAKEQAKKEAKRGELSTSHLRSIISSTEEPSPATKSQAVEKGRKDQKTPAVQSKKEQLPPATKSQAVEKGRKDQKTSAVQSKKEQLPPATKNQAVEQAKKEAKRVELSTRHLRSITSSTEAPSPATKNQAVERGRKDQKTSAVQSKKEQLPPATKNQAVEKDRKRRHEPRADSGNQEKQAFTNIQDVEQGRKDRQQLTEQHAAATRIQAVHRGRQQRKQGNSVDEDGIRRVVTSEKQASQPQRTGVHFRVANPPPPPERKILRITRGGQHKSYYNLKKVPTDMRINDVILHDYKRQQLIRRRQKAEKAYATALSVSQVHQAPTQLTIAEDADTTDLADASASETLAKISDHLEHMNKLAAGIPRPEDQPEAVDLDLFLREIEAYQTLSAPPKAEMSVQEWVAQKREQRAYAGFFVGAKVVTTDKKPKLGIVIQHETRGSHYGVICNFQIASIDGKGKEAKWVPLMHHCMGCATNEAIEPVAKRLKALQRDNLDLSQYDE